jgi:predicted enzyme related to lactoylglutathione lyase
MHLAPLALNHVGITVPDVFAAIDWYGEVFACTHVMGPRLMSVDVPATAETGPVFGPGFRRLLQAHLLTGNGVGIELFEPLDPKPLPPAEALEYRRCGPWHFALTHPDVDAILERIVANGGHQHSAAHNFAPGRPWRLAYARDPWWTTIEIVSHTYAEMFSNWPQPGATTLSTMINRDDAVQLRAES